MITRRPYVEKRIKDLVEGDKVKVTGVVVDKVDGELLVDDGTGMTRVWVDNTTAEVSDLVQVFGRVFDQDGKIIKADILRNVNGLNIELYKKLVDKEG